MARRLVLRNIFCLKYLYGFAILILWVIGLKHMQTHFIDYGVYSKAADLILVGQATEIYDVQRTVPGGFYYPYFFALVFSVFVLMGSITLH